MCVCVWVCVCFFLVLPTSIHLQYPSHKRWGCTVITKKRQVVVNPKGRPLGAAEETTSFRRGCVHWKIEVPQPQHCRNPLWWRLLEAIWWNGNLIQEFWELKMKSTLTNKKGWRTSALTGNPDEIQEATSMKWAMGGCVFHYDFTLPLL